MSMRVRLVSINEMLCALTAGGNRAMVNRDMSSLCVSKIIVGCCFAITKLQRIIDSCKVVCGLFVVSSAK